MNIPQVEISQIIQYALENSDISYDTFITEIQNLVHTVLKQNYFQFNNVFYKQAHGLTLGARISAVFSDIYLQFLEQ
jgi:hypothetical protein